MIADEVWARLEPTTGMGGRAERRRVLRAAWALASVALVTALGWGSGAVAPRLVETPRDIGTRTFEDELGRPGAILVEMERWIENEGWLPVTINGVAMRGPGVRVASVTVADGGSLPVTIPPGERAAFVLGIDVTDCDSARTAPPDLVVDSEHWWGSRATTVSRPEYADPNLGFHLDSPCAR
ncbi:hypothetical protein ACWGH8_12055 [Nonomuraea muscovyensis]|uniref:Uncharacterized protein n=1 Tax=Nonomuraea muscovyensis TaxID=1124761 RepID=A0A7X0F254_9ACTN|nr:hypothetical protein [Nonomuraea muscovyensis]MBB6350599.1 hypothetical protein [Nonomuraea muscovyensis]